MKVGGIQIKWPVLLIFQHDCCFTQSCKRSTHANNIFVRWRPAPISQWPRCGVADSSSECLCSALCAFSDSLPLEVTGVVITNSGIAIGLTTPPASKCLCPAPLSWGVCFLIAVWPWFGLLLPPILTLSAWLASGMRVFRSYGMLCSILDDPTLLFKKVPRGWLVRPASFCSMIAVLPSPANVLRMQIIFLFLI
jgi:hypothetical protein